MQEDSVQNQGGASPPKKPSPEARPMAILDSKNKDLDDLYQEDKDAEASQQVPKLNLKKKIVRRAQEDGFFKTGVEVVENEEYEFEGTT